MRERRKKEEGKGKGKEKGRDNGQETKIMVRKLRLIMKNNRNEWF